MTCVRACDADRVLGLQHRRNVVRVIRHAAGGQPRLSLPQKAIRTEKMFEALQIRLEQEPRYQSAIGMELRRLVLNSVVEIVRDLS